MGVKGLIGGVIEETKNSKGEITNGYYHLCFTELADWLKKNGRRYITMTVDIMPIFYSSTIAIRNSGKDLKNERGMITSGLQGVFRLTCKFVSCGIIPVYIFEGQSPKHKKEVVAARRKEKDEARALMQKALETEDDKTFIKYFKKCYSPSDQEFNECRKMLTLMGIPWFDAPGEAEVACTWIASRIKENGERIVKGVYTEDSDVIPLGVEYMFKKPNVKEGGNSKKEITVIKMHTVLKDMGLTTEQLQDMCSIMNNDLCRTEGIGPETAYDLIKRYGDLETIIRNDERVYNNQECCRKARDYFRSALTDLDDSDFKVTPEDLKLKRFQRDELEKFMIQEHGFNKQEIQNSLRILSSAYYSIMAPIPTEKKTRTERRFYPVTEAVDRDYRSVSQPVIVSETDRDRRLATIENASERPSTIGGSDGEGYRPRDYIPSNVDISERTNFGKNIAIDVIKKTTSIVVPKNTQKQPTTPTGQITVANYFQTQPMTSKNATRYLEKVMPMMWV